MFWNRKYLPQEGLDALNRYKYQGGGYTWLDNKLNPFWAALAEILPDTMAANLVTLIGTFHLLFMGLLVLIFDPTLTSSSPTWVYWVNSWCLFAYQTLDAVDGKQARRTNTSSPLGQLFDHGCDALGTTYCVLSMCSVMGFGPSIGTLAILATVQIPFYMAQWEVGQFGVTEALLVSSAGNALRALMGRSFWLLTIGDIVPPLSALPVVSDWQIRVLAVVGSLVFPAYGAIRTFYTVYGKATNYPKALVLLTPLVFHQTFLWYLVYSENVGHVFKRYPVIVFAVAGLLFSQMCNIIIVGSVCHLEFPWMHKILVPIPPILLFFHEMNPTDIQIWTTLGVYSVLIVLQYAHYAYTVTQEICLHLDIYCLSIKKKKVQ